MVGWDNKNKYKNTQNFKLIKLGVTDGTAGGEFCNIVMSRIKFTEKLHDETFSQNCKKDIREIWMAIIMVLWQYRSFSNVSIVVIDYFEFVNKFDIAKTISNYIAPISTNLNKQLPIVNKNTFVSHNVSQPTSSFACPVSV